MKQLLCILIFPFAAWAGDNLNCKLAAIDDGVSTLTDVALEYHEWENGIYFEKRIQTSKMFIGLRVETGGDAGHHNEAFQTMFMDLNPKDAKWGGQQFSAENAIEPMPDVKPDLVRVAVESTIPGSTTGLHYELTCPVP